MSLLEVEGLRTVFETHDGELPAVDGIDLEVEEGETLGLVGESGSGKSVTALSILGLVDKPGKIEAGRIHFDGHDMRALGEDQRRELLGNDVSMIFQRAQESLNPVFSVGEQITETLQVHGYDGSNPWDRAVELLDTVGIPSPEENAKKYPHQYSGGMAQRAMIAIAIAGNPKLLIADEPTTALDVTIEAQILELLEDLQTNLGMSMIFISHDLGVIWEVCDRVAVMYLGKIVEVAETEELFENPKHPYTKALLQCLPQTNGEMEPIPGPIPKSTDRPSGCTFHPRCPYASEACSDSFPAMEEFGEHRSACYLHTDVDENGKRPNGKLPDQTSVEVHEQHGGNQ